MSDGFQDIKLQNGWWQCQDCGNSNMPNREVCNMTRCGASRPAQNWICACGNENYPKRTHCNMRKCGLPRPGLHLMKQSSRTEDKSFIIGRDSPLSRKDTFSNSFSNSGKFGSYNENSDFRCLEEPVTKTARTVGESLVQPVFAQDPSGWLCVCGAVNMGDKRLCIKESCRSMRQSQISLRKPAYDEDGVALIVRCSERDDPTDCPDGYPIMSLRSQFSISNVQDMISSPAFKHFKAMMSAVNGVDVCMSSFAGNGLGSFTGGHPETQVRHIKETPGSNRRRDPPAGSWKCEECGNINWPQRKSCNRKFCCAPRPENAELL